MHGYKYKNAQSVTTSTAAGRLSHVFRSIPFLSINQKEESTKSSVRSKDPAGERMVGKGPPAVDKVPRRQKIDKDNRTTPIRGILSVLSVSSGSVRMDKRLAGELRKRKETLQRSETKRRNTDATAYRAFIGRKRCMQQCNAVRRGNLSEYALGGKHRMKR